GMSHSCLSGIFAWGKRSDYPLVGGEAGPADVPLPTSDQKSASTSYQVCLLRPPDFFQESSSKAIAGFCGIFSSRERPNRASPLLIVHMFFSKIKGERDSVRSHRHLFARPAMKYQFI